MKKGVVSLKKCVLGKYKSLKEYIFCCLSSINNVEIILDSIIDESIEML